MGASIKVLQVMNHFMNNYGDVCRRASRPAFRNANGLTLVIVYRDHIAPPIRWHGAISYRGDPLCGHDLDTREAGICGQIEIGRKPSCDQGQEDVGSQATSEVRVAMQFGNS